MADKLIYELQDIKNDRETNLKPENLKKGVTCLGITGTYEITAEEIGLTPEVLKSGVTILGLTGTYEGESLENV